MDVDGPSSGGDGALYLVPVCKCAVSLFVVLCVLLKRQIANAPRARIVVVVVLWRSDTRDPRFTTPKTSTLAPRVSNQDRTRRSDARSYITSTTAMRACAQVRDVQFGDEEESVVVVVAVVGD